MHLSYGVCPLVMQLRTVGAKSRDSGENALLRPAAARTAVSLSEACGRAGQAAGCMGRSLSEVQGLPELTFVCAFTSLARG